MRDFTSQSVADFRKDNVDIVKDLFRRFNSLLKEHNLFASHDTAIDGTKMKAVNSMDRSYTNGYLKKQQDRIDEKIEKYLREMDENDAIEQDIDGSKVREAMEKLKERKRKLDEIGRKMEESGLKELSLTDPEARQMKTRHGLDVCYNAHIAVESEHHIITDYMVDNNTNDYASIVPLTEGTKEFLDDFELSANKGHFSLPNLEKLEKSGIKAYIPSAEHGKPDRSREGRIYLPSG